MFEDERWLERWLPQIKLAAAGDPILELGCGEGRDTRHLVASGLHVVASDVDPKALRTCAERVPEAMLVRHNLRYPFPFADQCFPVVLASLCLHYFLWQDSLALIARLRRLLPLDGLLLCRLNSTRDVLHGAQGYPQIETDFYAVDGRFSSSKRFFHADSVRALFAQGWHIESMEERTIHRYAEPKVVWEVLLRAV